MWLGVSSFNKGMYFFVPDDYKFADTYKFEREKDGKKIMRVASICWFTNIEHGRRHLPLPLMTMEDNLRFSKHKEIRESNGYQKYENYDAIEVPFYDAIPADYDGIMGVPVTFIDKYCPEQFEIIVMTENLDLYGLKTKRYTTEECREAYKAKFGKPGTYDLNASAVIRANGVLEKLYARILIRKKK